MTISLKVTGGLQDITTIETPVSECGRRSHGHSAHPTKFGSLFVITVLVVFAFLRYLIYLGSLTKGMTNEGIKEQVSPNNKTLIRSGGWASNQDPSR